MQWMSKVCVIWLPSSLWRSSPASMLSALLLSRGKGDSVSSGDKSWSQGLVFLENALGQTTAHFGFPPERGVRGTF